MKITVLNARQMSEVFSMKDAIQADKDALQLYSEGKSTIPLRANLDIKKYNGQTLYMYGYAEPAKASGVKIVSVYPDNIEKGLTSVPATMILVNCETGEVNCMMDGTHLTRIRTGAVAGAAACAGALQIESQETLWYMSELSAAEKSRRCGTCPNISATATQR